MLIPAAAHGQRARAEAKADPHPRVFAERTGALPAREGQWLRVSTDIGTVRVFTSRALPPGQMAYRVRVEADASQPDAQKLVEQFLLEAKTAPDGVLLTGRAPWRKFRGRIFVSFDVNLPRRYNLDIQTQAGSVSVEDIHGQVSIASAGGNLTLGRVGGPAKLETEGGHITVKSVDGNLNAYTAGGHVYVGPVQGDATVKSLGGHINVASVQGNAQFETAGGNIQVQRAAAGITASTQGGRIDVGEAVGAIRAKTAGGGIRVVNLFGPTQLETSGGSIYLTRVQGPVRAMTAEGGITAWIASGTKLQVNSLLESGSGDIVVYVPRDLAITIEASVEGDGDHRIEPEPGIPLKILYSAPGPRPRLIRGEAKLNGGGDVLRLRALAGDIKLKYLDAIQADWEVLFRRQMDLFEKAGDIEKIIQYQNRIQDQMHVYVEQMRPGAQPASTQGVAPPALTPEQQRAIEEEKRSAVERWRLELQKSISGRIEVSPDIQNRKLLSKVKPEYPELARRNEIQGIVWVEIHIDKEGKVEQVNRIDGHPVLVQAAMEAVKQWQYAPTYLNGRPVAVATVARFEFRMN